MTDEFTLEEFKHRAQKILQAREMDNEQGNDLPDEVRGLLNDLAGLPGDNYLKSKKDRDLSTSKSQGLSGPQIEPHEGDLLILLSAAFEQSANAIVITDTNGNIQYANPRFYQTSEYTEEEVLGKNPRFLKYENSAINYKKMWDTIVSGKTWKGEFLNRSKSGKLYWEMGTITPVKNQQGQIINFLAIKEDITKRKNAEESLQRAKDFYLNLLEDFPVMVWKSDAAGRVDFTNKTLLNFTGPLNNMEVGVSYPDNIHPKDRRVFEGAFEQGLKEKKSFEVEYRLKDKFQNYRWVLNHGKPFNGPDGEYGGFISTCIDIHDRKTAEQKLTESEDKFRRMFEDSSLGIFRLDRNFSFVSANKAFASMFGFENPVDLLMEINNFPSKYFKEFDNEKSFMFEVVKSAQDRFVVEKEMIDRDGNTLHTLIHLRRVNERSADKEFYLEGFIEDISHRKIAEMKLLFSEQKYRSLFDKSYDAIVILQDFTIVDCNLKSGDLFGVSCNELNGNSYLNISSGFQYSGEASELALRNKLELALSGKPQIFDWLHLRDGRTFDAEVSISRIYLNERSMIQAIVRDVSEKRRVEKQLKQARDDAEKARMAQSEFLSLMSHEIRTPLNAVLTLTDLMLHENLNDDLLENLSSVKISAKHLLGLIDDILDYNKIESGNIQFEKTSFNPRSLIQELEKALGVKAREKNLDFVVEIPEDMPETLISDTLRLKQVLYNMLSNAIKFTEQGFVSLSAEVNPINEHNYSLSFEVRDSGIGIATDKLEAIFDRFTQAETSTTRKYGGSGLGLSICKKLVELQGGKISATSKPGKGSVFYFNIPVEKGEQGSFPLMENQKPNETMSLKGMKILMVEDDKMNQFVGRKIIEKKWNANLIIASSGEEALTLLEKEQFDLVLMDLLLPAMDGYELTRIIRHNASNKIKDSTIPIIALTADAFLETRKKAIKAGMDGFLTKPFDYQKLLDVLSRYKNLTGNNA